MIKEIIAFRDELKRINEDHKSAMISWSPVEVDRHLEILDGIIDKNRIKRREYRIKKHIEKMKVYNLLNEKTAKPKVSN
jgi:hypothetical protein